MFQNIQYVADSIIKKGSATSNVIYILRKHFYKQKWYRAIEENSEHDFIANRHISKSLYRYASIVYAIVFHAGHSYSTVFTAYTFVASAKCWFHFLVL